MSDFGFFLTVLVAVWVLGDMIKEAAKIIAAAVKEKNNETE